MPGGDRLVDLLGGARLCGGDERDFFPERVAARDLRERVFHFFCDHVAASLSFFANIIPWRKNLSTAQSAEALAGSKNMIYCKKRRMRPADDTSSLNRNAVKSFL